MTDVAALVLARYDARFYDVPAGFAMQRESDLEARADLRSDDSAEAGPSLAREIPPSLVAVEAQLPAQETPSSGAVGLEREAFEEWPSGGGRWTCCRRGRGEAMASVDVGPHEELRLPSRDPGLLQILSALDELETADSPANPEPDSNAPSEDSLSPVSGCNCQCVHPDDRTTDEASSHPPIDVEEARSSPGNSNVPSMTPGDGDGDAGERAQLTRGVKRRYDECQADSEERAAAGKRLRRDASMLLTGAALTYAALAYL